LSSGEGSSNGNGAEGTDRYASWVSKGGWDSEGSAPPPRPPVVW
jgi:hypothetical protein